MILAASLSIACMLGVAYLIGHCIWYCRKPPRNRYVKRAPSRDCQRWPDWRQAERTR